MQGVVITILSFLVLDCQAVTDGFHVSILDAPFVLSLRLDGNHTCGASIINQRWGLTAAHCIRPYSDANPERYSVRSGSILREHLGKLHTLTTFTPYNLYTPDGSDYDIAVFSVDPPFRFGRTTQPIALPTEDTNDNYGIVVGWGAITNTSSELSDILNGVIVPKVDRSTCIYNYRKMFKVHPRNICYGYSYGRKDSCNGDSGGPLFNFDKVLLGITSWGDSCGVENMSGVYTDVKLFIDWIQNKTRI